MIDDLSLVLDVPVLVSVELGKRSILISELISLGPGSVIELGKAAGESLDVLVNGKLVARGEAVVVGEKYGIRIVEVIRPGSQVAVVDTATEQAANDRDRAA